jgi:hypothetical protein
MSKQTAVEWLVKQLNQKIDFIPLDKWDMIRNIVQEAKAMEKMQIVDAFDEGKSDGYKTAREWDEMIIWLSAEQYYNETYGGNN